MKKISTVVFIVLSCITLFLSCSKGEDAPKDNPVGGDAFKMQVMTIDLPNTSLPNSEYHGSMGNSDITLTKGDEHKLLFMVPSAVELGSQDLVINDLNNLKITYNVKVAALPDSPDAVISQFQNNLTTFQATTSGNISTQKAIDSFNQVYSNATDEEKSAMATLYYVNKAVFDDIILNDYSNVSGKNCTSDGMANLFKHKVALLAVAVGVVIVCAPPLSVSEKVAGAALAVLGMYKSYGFWSEFASCKLNTVQFSIDNIFGKNVSSPSTDAISLNNNVALNLTFNSVDRTVIAADSNKDNSGIQLCFTYHYLYNEFAQQINPIIQWINNNVPFANFDTIPLEIMPVSNATQLNLVDANKYSHLVFSINNSNLTLVSSSLSSTGQLNLKVKINGTATTAVNGTLNYTFSDEFSTISGSFPITVNIDSETVIIGNQTWMLKNLDVDHYQNGDPIPQVTDATQWLNLTTGAWCYYNNNTANGPVYGKLYNWYAVNDPRGLAPIGYHIPTDTEWSILTSYLGGVAVAGGKLKESGTVHWLSPNAGATNSSGFTGLPGGYNNEEGNFVTLGSMVYWWSSTEYSTTLSWCYSLDYNSGAAYKPKYLKNYGFSVRCIKD